MRILIVDDNASDRGLLHRDFERRGVVIDEAGNGHEALAAAAKARPDLIVSDAMMPEMDGFQLLRAVKADPVLKDVPFVFYSAVYQGDREHALAEALGADEFLSKPMTPNELWAELIPYIEGERPAGKPSRDPEILLKADEEFLRRYSQVVVDTLESKVAALNREIFEHKRTEAELRTAQLGLRTALQEKDSLLREVHHRVKNNLQVVSSLLRLQTESARDPGLRSLLDESRRRIHAIALVHEKLYKSGSLSRIDFGDYIRSMVVHLFQAGAPKAAAVTPVVEAADIVLDIQKAVPLALLLGEIVSNSIRHAFPDGRKGEVRVAFGPCEGGRLCLRVADNGVGMPAGIDAQAGKSLGLEIIRLLSGQIEAEAKLETAPGGGTAWTLTFAP